MDIIDIIKKNKLLFLLDMIPSKFLFNSSWKYEIMLQLMTFSLDAQCQNNSMLLLQNIAWISWNILENPQVCLYQNIVI